MSPLITTKAGASANAYGWGAASAAGTAFESIASTTVGPGGSSSVNFSSLTSSYTHLQFRILGRSQSTGYSQDSFAIQFNSDTASNYWAYHDLQGDGTSATAANYGNYTQILSNQTIATSDASNTLRYGALIVDILDFASTTKYKTVRVTGGNDRNGSGQMMLTSGLWRSTAAVTSIQIKVDSATWAQNSVISLYGIKEAA